jgi:hypothetical protein
VRKNVPLTGSLYARTGRTGPPSKYTPATIKKLLDALADGMTQKSACVVAGISESTIHEWKRALPELQQRMDEAREKARHKMLKIVKDAAPKDWRAAAEYLKLVHAEDYRRVQQPSQTLHLHQPTIVTLSPERQREIQAQRARIAATIKDTAPRETPRIQPTGFLVRPEEREALPVKEAEVISDGAATAKQQAQQEAARKAEQERSEIARQIFNTYTPKRDEQNGDDGDIF